MSAPKYLRNCWYVAAWPNEIGDTPLMRKILGEPLVFFRDGDGRIAALSDRCPHRKAPLSSGAVEEGGIACGYHGIRFDRNGRCVHVPGEVGYGTNFAVRAYEVREMHGFVFIWMGEAEKADAVLIPDFSENEKPGWAAVRDTLLVNCDYQLLVDNLLDLTHVVFVHKTTLGGSNVTDTPLEVSVDGDVVRAHRFMHNVDTAPIYKAARGYNGKIDRWQIFEWRAPSYIKLTLGARETGTDVPVGTPTHRVLNALTPETETTTHYFWSTARDWALDDPKIDAIYFNMTVEAFNEDKAIVEQQQDYISGDESGAPLIAFNFDRAGQLARRILRGKIEEEAEAMQPRARAG
ncbi:aromatic ring-hydroxylating dioxygenase subunit alpha [Roseiarcaceae bacterium H3SJ34-1]|uniref:aromatic ring-hydroxylating dioxygenase subunit alpha n=1 Tax=Terripilifer ovatus TaxID=3032367 RepID=UPI003AB92B77|nr:aromatic ring-hydroxylating dioxygenase subunit alpha [Roseiarcaceae bacterium H3SJ34-1]